MKNANKEEMESILNRLLNSDKPKVIAGKFSSIKELDEEKIKHFKTAKYLWQLKLHDKNDEYKNMHAGVLLDENLNYVHMVFVTKPVLEYLLSI